MLRHGTVPALAGERDGGVVRGRHRRTFTQHEPALGNAGHVVHREDRVAGMLVEQAVGHHAQRAAAAFFGRLEDQVQRTVEATLFGQMPRGCQQHRGVAIVTAGMHQAGPAARPCGAGGLGHGQRIHVGPQPEPVRAVAAHQRAHDTGAAESAFDPIAPGFELVGHQRRGAMLLEGELRMLVDVPPQADELADPGPQCVHQVGHVASGVTGAAG